MSTSKSTSRADKSHESKETSGAQFKVGDRVSWESSGGTSEGSVVRVARRSGQIKGFAYRATTSDPRYIVETDEGKHAAHKAEGLHKA